MRSGRFPAAPVARLRTRAAALGARLRAAAGDFLGGCVGLGEYERYLAHQRRHHEGQAPLGRAAFFRRELSVRWDGVRRCC